jgi:protein-disulfide isomerase
MIAAVAFIGGFVLGSLWSENKMLKAGLGGTGTLPTGAAAPDAAAVGSLSDMPEITDADHVRGNRDAQVILVEYSDYECPFCNRFHPTMQQVMEEYGDQVAWVYRHFPLTSIHPQAQISAQAAECVAQLGGEDAFWNYSDLLFEKASVDGGTALTEDKLVSYAAQVGVTSSALQSCLDSNETAAAVNEDAAGGSAAGISGTPGTILVTADGDYELISGALPFEQVSAVIDQYL